MRPVLIGAGRGSRLQHRTEEIPKKDVGTDLSGSRLKTYEDPSAFRPPAADKEISRHLRG